MNINNALAFMLILFTFILFAVIIKFELGGSEALFAILGYIAGWANTIILFYFRKKPGENK